MKTSELTGKALDWAVARCEFVGDLPFVNIGNELRSKHDAWHYHPSTDWAQGGPIIQRENIGLWSEGYDWEAKISVAFGEWLVEWDESPLVAAMRCYVASKLGDTVEIPPELI
jgi:hypothetical protein